MSNKTEIFDSYSLFLAREDKSINGVSPLFAKNNPSYKKANEKNSGCYDCYDCYDCSRCSDCSDCSRCSGCSDCSRCYNCSHCSGCYNCSRCSGCSDCSDCSDCYNCSGCSDCYNCSKIEATDKSICITGAYKYTCCPRIKENGEQWVQLGCHLRKREDWLTDFWNNESEFPNDGSQRSKDRLFVFNMACSWLDKESKANNDKD